MTLDRSTLDPEWQRAFDFVEARVGGRIIDAERQARWRPAWFLDLECDGEQRSVYFRGGRGGADHGVYPLRHEYLCMSILEKHGIPVPHLYGFCEDPEGIVMDKAPGRINLATATDDAERTAVCNHYMEILAQIHQLDLAAFESTGLAHPSSAEELALGDFDAWESAFRKTKNRPEPLVEFGIDWLRRNVPQGRERVSFLTGDCGQFLFEDSRVTAVIDLELAYIGDPAADLGALFSRDLSEPLGDLPAAVRHYEQVSGDSIDPRVVMYHAIRFGMVTPLSTALQVTDPAPVTEFVQYLLWYHVYGRCSIELIAHLGGIEVPAAELPRELETPHSVGHDVLRDRLAALDRGDSFQAYKLDAITRTAEYLRRADRYGAEIEELDLDDAAELLGRRPESWKERDAALEALIATNEGDLDAGLVRYLVRHCQRQEFLLAPVARELADTRIQTLG